MSDHRHDDAPATMSDFRWADGMLTEHSSRILRLEQWADEMRTKTPAPPEVAPVSFTDARAVLVEAFKDDTRGEIRSVYVDNIAMALHDGGWVTDFDARNAAARRVMAHLFGEATCRAPDPAPVSDGVLVAAHMLLDGHPTQINLHMDRLRDALDAAPAPRGLVGFSDQDLEDMARRCESAKRSGGWPGSWADLAARIRACKANP